MTREEDCIPQRTLSAVADVSRSKERASGLLELVTALVAIAGGLRVKVAAT
jgi:hypothetical protein